MIELKLTDLEARKLRDILEKLKQMGNRDADLARVHHKVHRAIQKPAVKRKYTQDPLKKIMVRMDGEDT